ncbi:MAG: IS200/IS605 family transposase, partial [Acidobacteriota bacterium]|nr:IS200/IS605 family transposase [Acidobacteriota bacterium]
MSQFIHKSHNVSVLLFHIVCPAKYRRAVFSAEVDAKLKQVCV